MNQDQK